MYCGSQRHLPGEQLVVQGVWNHLQARLVVSHQLDQFVLVHEALLGLLEHLEGQVLQVYPSKQDKLYYLNHYQLHD